MIQESDASTFPYFMAFLLAYGTIRAIRILIDLKQLRLYRQSRPDGYTAELFTNEEFQDS